MSRIIVGKKEDVGRGGKIFNGETQMSLRVYRIDKKNVIEKLEVYTNDKSFDELSCKLPQGVYSTFRTYDGGTKVIGLSLHLDRLYKPSQEYNLVAAVSEYELREMLRKLIVANEKQEFRIRLSLSMMDQPGKIFIMLEDLKRIREEVYENGVSVVTSTTGRENPRLKSTAFIQNSALERKSLLSDDIYEVLMVKNGRILEGMTSNFYTAADSTVTTARNGILLGVTRRIILRLLRNAGNSIGYRSFRVVDLPLINEAFITSSSRGVVPVVKVDGLVIGEGRPGIISRKLRKLYDEYVSAKAERI